MFPLGGRRGEAVEIALGAQKVTADLRRVPPRQPVAFVNVPDGAGLPVAVDVGEFPEFIEPISGAVAIPATVNGRLSKQGETDRYEFTVRPGDELAFEIRARDLGTSKIAAVIQVTDEKGQVIGRSGDEPIPDDLYSVGTSKTAGDPFLYVAIPEGVNKIAVAVEDLALRGGAGFAYRLIGRRASQEFLASIGTPYINIPSGGTVAVPVVVERRGYMGDVRFRLARVPKGVTVEGGYIPPQNQAALQQGNRGIIRRGVLFLSSDAGVKIDPQELRVEAVGRLPDGRELVRTADGLGMQVGVAGATIQGSVDRQRALTAPWLGMELPAAGTRALPARLEVKVDKVVRKDAGDELTMRWKWTGRGVSFPPTVTQELISAADVRAIDMKQDPGDPSTGTFLITTTRLTLPGQYDFYVTGRVAVDGQNEDIVSRPITVQIEEPKEKPGAAATVAGQ
jgi:hypothetical protein